MNKKGTSQPSPGPDADVEEILGLLDALLAVIGEENRQLAGGLPASLSQAVSEKSRLAVSLEGIMAAIRAQTITIADAAPLLQLRLTDRSNLLSLAMAENTTRLRSAIEATRRRVDAVMSAIREDASCAGVYQADGLRVRRQREVPGKTGHWA